MQASLAQSTDNYGELVGNKNYWMEEKLDGRRLIVEYDGKELSFFNRKGERATLTNKAKDYLRSHTPSLPVTYDGELVGEEFYLFDVLKFDGVSLLNVAYAPRRLIVEQIADKLGYKMPRFANSLMGKAELFNAVEEEGGEGVVFKDMDSVYKQGKNYDWLKYKFVKTADVFVTDTARKGLESLSMAVYLPDGKPYDVGGVRYLPIFKGLINVNDVIEVRYLMVSDEMHLMQPHMLRKRDDKTPEECTSNQFD